jgi:hypothetical protein
MPGQNPLPQKIGREQRAGAKAHIIGAPDEPDAGKTAQGLGQVNVKLADLFADGINKRRLVKYLETHRLQSEQPTDVLEDVGGKLVAAHIGRQALLQPLEPAKINVYHPWPVELLKISPALNGPGVLFNPVPPVTPLAGQARGIFGPTPGKAPKLTDAEVHPENIVAQQTMQLDVTLHAGELIRGVGIGRYVEASAKPLLDFFVEEKLNMVNPPGSAPAADATQEGLDIRLYGNIQKAHLTSESVAEGKTSRWSLVANDYRLSTND